MKLNIEKIDFFFTKCHLRQRKSAAKFQIHSFQTQRQRQLAPFLRSLTYELQSCSHNLPRRGSYQRICWVLFYQLQKLSKISNCFEMHIIGNHNQHSSNSPKPYVNKLFTNRKCQIHLFSHQWRLETLLLSIMHHAKKFWRPSLSFRYVPI